MSEVNVFKSLCRPVQRLLDERGFNEPTEPQKRIIPLILEGKNVLLISATATGKTEAAMLPIMDRFLMSPEKITGISILYITPLRALNRDILDRMTYWCNRLDIKLGIRHGDTGTKERNWQRISPPNMLITTPETLQAIILGRTLKQYLRSVRWIIIDEIHELADNKRGSQLSLALERIRELANNPPQMIGLSATIGSPEKVANFLVGVGRPVEIIQISALRETMFEIILPEPDIQDYEIATQLFTHPEVSARLKAMRNLIEEHKTTLIFTNTRSTSEVLTSRFNLWNTNFPLSIHHGSLAKTSRIATEQGLKSGELRTVICTSSLELGIDIGNIDLVIQYNSPRQVTRLLQRVGRSGHRLGRVSKGIIVSLNSDDAFESMVICRRSLDEIMEPLRIPDKPYDVLVNQITAELLQRGRIYFLQVLNLFKNAYPYANLTIDDIKLVANYMHDRYPRLAWVNPEDEVILRPRGTRKTIYNYFFNNLSMIPDEKDYLVLDGKDDSPVGILQEAFVAEYAKPGVKFTLRGSVWRILNIYNDKIYVKAEDDPTGAIPSWIGEEIPVPYEVAQEVGEIKANIESKLISGFSPQQISEMLSEKYPAKPETIMKAMKGIVEQNDSGFPVPTNKRIILENWEDNVLIHANFGTLVNRTLARLIGYVLSEEIGYPVGVQQETYMISTQTVGEVDGRYILKMLKTLSKSDLETKCIEAVSKTGMFKRRLINVARKAGALSKFADFSNVTLGRLIKSFENTAIYEEALKDTIRLDMDIKQTITVLNEISSGNYEVILSESDELSPLGKIGVESISMKTDIIPPDRIDRIILESAKVRLYSETRVLACHGKNDWLDDKRIKDLEEVLICPICGSKEIGIYDRSIEEVQEMQYLEKSRSKKERPKWWDRGKDISKLVSIYGRRAAIIGAAKRVDLTTAWDILAETEGESDEFFTHIIEAERESLKKRFI
ncbi:DEAD/DEAH box helicase [Candidatus Bathyarchaeota archaeon]|nr:DEAD/DEAH box helicase [Candidatus Bathyarchaeota archaeon]